MDAAQEVFEELGSEAEARRVSRLVLNAYAEDKGIGDTVKKLRSVAATYQGFDQVDPASGLGCFVYRWRTVDAGTTTSILLWLFSRPDDVMNEGQRLEAIAALESFLMR